MDGLVLACSHPAPHCDHDLSFATATAVAVPAVAVPAVAVPGAAVPGAAIAVVLFSCYQ